MFVKLCISQDHDVYSNPNTVRRRQTIARGCVERVQIAFAFFWKEKKDGLRFRYIMGIAGAKEYRGLQKIIIMIAMETP